MASFDERASALVNFLQRIIISYSIDDPTKLNSLYLNQKERDSINGFSLYVLNSRYIDKDHVEKVYDITLYGDNAVKNTMGNIIRNKSNDYYCEIVIIDDEDFKHKPEMEFIESTPGSLVIIIPKYCLVIKPDDSYYTTCERFGEWYKLISDIYEKFVHERYVPDGLSHYILDLRKFLAVLGFIKSSYTVDLDRFVKDIFAYMYNIRRSQYPDIKAIAHVINNSNIDWNDTLVGSAISTLLEEFDSGNDVYWKALIDDINNIIESKENPYGDCQDAIDYEKLIEGCVEEEDDSEVCEDSSSEE